MKKLVLMLIFISFGLQASVMQVFPKDFIHWEKGIVPYSISSSFSEHERNFIFDQIAEFSKNTGIVFIDTSDEGSEDLLYELDMGMSITLEIERSEFVCNSLTRTDKSTINGKSYRKKISSKINLSGECMKPGKILHELGHSIGLKHEQFHPDRDNFLHMNLTDEQKQNKHLFAQVGRILSSDELAPEGGGFDPNSIMLYSSKFYSVGEDGHSIRGLHDKSLVPSISAKHSCKNDFNISDKTIVAGNEYHWFKSSQKLSELDKSKVKDFYKKEFDKRSIEDSRLIDEYYNKISGIQDSIAVNRLHPMDLNEKSCFEEEGFKHPALFYPTYCKCLEYGQTGKNIWKCFDESRAKSGIAPRYEL